jgi:succinoglycan biosynthesis protein ExoM
MSSEKVHIDICVATYRRPALLSVLITSLLRQKVDDALYFRIVIVDNDAAQTARSVVESFISSPVPIIYVVEPVQGISFARNRCVSLCEGNYVAFIDDDEYADDCWLQGMMNTMERFNADIVLGPVIPLLPPDVSSWITVGRFFERSRYATGASLTDFAVGNIGNALIRRDVLNSVPGPFDPEFALTGGEDSAFFASARQKGVSIIWCDTASVYETIPTERTNLLWLARRAFRCGQGHARLVVKQHGYLYGFFWLLYRFVHLFATVAAALVVLPMRMDIRVKVFLKVCRNLGRLSAVTGLNYREYARK